MLLTNDKFKVREPNTNAKTHRTCPVGDKSHALIKT